MKVYEILTEAFSPNMKVVLKELISLFSKHRINYVIGGANALAIYSERPRTTVDIDAFVSIDQKEVLDKAMLDAKFNLIYNKAFQSKFEKLGVEVDLLYAGNDAEKWSISKAKKNSILGVAVKAATPEALLWLYLVSSKRQNFVDAIELVKSVKNLNIEEVKSHIKSDEKLVEKLDQIIKFAGEENSREIK